MKLQFSPLFTRWMGGWRSTLLPGLSMTGLVVLVRLLGGFQPLEWKLLDLALRIRPGEATDSRITLITITEGDIQGGLGYPISDGDLASLIEDLQTYEPRVIGVDIFRDRSIGEGKPALTQTLKAADNVVGINTIGSEFVIDAHPALPEEKIGFADALLDDDGYLRRSFLGSADDAGNYRFSLTIRMAEKYLAADNLFLENGLRDPETMRFGDTEIPRFQPNTGGYIRTDNGGNQTLINFRTGPYPFEKISYQALVNKQVNPELLQDRAILVGYTAESVKDFVSSGAIATDSPSLIPGMEIQAHAISQLLSAVYDHRPFLSVLTDSLEYLLILTAGLIGLALVNWHRKPVVHWAMVVVVTVAVLFCAYALMLMSLWFPVLPVTAAFFLNAVAVYPFKTQLKAQRNAHENFIDQTYNAIHNGPLQTLSGMLSDWPENHPTPPKMHADLRKLNLELRGIYETMRQELLLPDGQISIGQDHALDLRLSLQELLYEIYNTTLERKRDFYASIVQITTFEAMADDELSAKQKRDIGRFLEEALINVSKYAKDATRLTVICQKEENNNVIRVVDNGSVGLKETSVATRGGYGTKQAKKLASQLQGRFIRSPVEPKGVCCELRWPVKRSLWKP